MKKYFEFFSLLSPDELEKVEQYAASTFKIDREHIEFTAYLLALFAYRLLNEKIDELETRELIVDFLKEGDLTVASIQEMALMIKTAEDNFKTSVVH